MSGSSTPHFSSDPFDLAGGQPWLEPAHFSKSLSSALNHPKNAARASELFTYSEEPDFHDPFSELNLFLAQKIRQAMPSCGESKKWSHKIQETLLKKISPEFQKRFPHYRLGVSAIKKIWEKITYYSQQFQEQKEAIHHDGKLNITFFIRENLKQYASMRQPAHVHPYHWANKLAIKMSECIATLEGVRPRIDELTKQVWAAQRHLICKAKPEEIKSPYDEYDRIDKLIVKTVLEIRAKEPQIAQPELAHLVKEALHALHELPAFSSVDAMTATISSLLAEKLYATSAFHTCFLAPQKVAITQFIRRQIALCRAAYPSQQHTQLVRRILALYALASQVLKDLSAQQIHAAIEATYPFEQSKRPELPQAVYAFIAAESVLMKTDAYCHCPAFVCETIASAYQEAVQLPCLNGKESELLEVVIWKILGETEATLEKLPFRIGQRIEEEIANILIDNPKQAFSAIVYATVHFFKNTKELSLIKKWEALEKKIQIWTHQGDMALHWIQLDSNTPLFKLICEKGQSHSPEVLVSEVAQIYLNTHPELAAYLPQLIIKIWILYKYAFYTHFASSDGCSYDTFLKWHYTYLAISPLSQDAKLDRLQELSHKLAPLFPFDRTHAQRLLGSAN